MPARALLGASLAGVATFLLWDGLALALGMRWRLALAVGALAGAYALVCTAVIAVADDGEDETEADGEAFAAPGSEPRPDYLFAEPARRLSSGRRW